MGIEAFNLYLPSYCLSYSQLLRCLTDLLIYRFTDSPPVKHPQKLLIIFKIIKTFSVSFSYK